jgi:short-subunit dehydrogenase
VLVFGATSTIATEVAQIYAARGDRLHLVGRDPGKLARAVERCGAAEVSSQVADFSRLDDNAAVVREALTALGRCDLALIAHGDLIDQLATERDFAAAEASLRINLLSVVSLVVPLANHFELTRTGHLAVITSVAGDRGRPRNYTYGAAKGALTLYLQGVRSRLYSAGVHVSALKLGPVDTPMTTDHPKNALFATAQGAAQGIVRALDRRRVEAYIPWYWAGIMPIVKRLPEALFQKLPFLSGR